jgi:uncharacterized membrane protein
MNNRQLATIPQTRLAQGLGWFSIGLGLAELLAPRPFSKLIGTRTSPVMLALYGVREIASGLGILVTHRPELALWSRVAGDLLDLGSLASASRARKVDKKRIAMAAGAVVGAVALDAYAASRFRAKTKAQKAIQYKQSITIGRSPEEVYRFWRDLERLPELMGHLQSVRKIDDKRSHWVANGPAGSRIEWDAEIMQDQPSRMIAWRSLPGADVENAGVVRFEPAMGDRGTIVRLELEYYPPAGKLGAAFAALFGELPQKQTRVDLRRLKQILETGEVTKTEGQPAGRAKSTSRKYDDFLRA